MKYLAIFAAVALPLSVLSSCGKPQEVKCDGYNTIVQKNGPTLGYSPSSGVGIIYKAGHAFKDLNRNGKLDTYEDWRKAFRKRAEDLASQLSIEEIAGLMLYSGHQAVPGSSMGFGGMTLYGGKPYDESGAKPWDLSDNQKKFLSEDNLRAVLVTTVESPEVASDTGFRRTTPRTQGMRLLPHSSSTPVPAGRYPSGLRHWDLPQPSTLP